MPAVHKGMYHLVVLHCNRQHCLLQAVMATLVVVLASLFSPRKDDNDFVMLVSSGLCVADLCPHAWFDSLASVLSRRLPSKTSSC